MMTTSINVSPAALQTTSNTNVKKKFNVKKHGAHARMGTKKNAYRNILNSSGIVGQKKTLNQ